MSRISTQTIFQASIRKTSWRSYAISLTVHAGLIALSLVLVVPAVMQVHKAYQHLTLLAPMSEYKPKVAARHRLIQKLVATAKIPVPPPAIVAPILVKQIEIAEEPENKTVLPPPPEDLPVARMPAFTTQKVAAVASADLPMHSASTTLAKVGAFDSLNGPGQTGKIPNTGVVHQGGFGNPAGSVQPKSSPNSAIRLAGFPDVIAASPPNKKPESVGNDATPVEILFKPKPVYSTEARELRVEGKVSLQVVFQANGSIRVVCLVRGLGHGLDESAEQAAMRIRFKPAMRGGVPVDTNATVNISFELT